MPRKRFQRFEFFRAAKIRECVVTLNLIGAYQGPFLLWKSVDKDQTTQNVQSDLRSTLSDNNILPPHLQYPEVAKLGFCFRLKGFLAFHNPFPNKPLFLRVCKGPTGSVVRCLTRNPGVLGSSRTRSSGFFRGSVLGQDTSDPSPGKHE